MISNYCGADRPNENDPIYLSQLKAKNPYKIHVINNKKINPIIWEIGHLTVTQNWLVMYLCKGPAERIHGQRHLDR